MNAARAGRSAAGLAIRRTGSTPTQAVSRQAANKTSTASKGKGVVGAPKKPVSQETVTPPTKPPAVAHETLTPPTKPPQVPIETLTPPLPPKGAATAALPPTKKSGNNLLLGAVLVGAVGASYYVTIHKMKDQDFLGQVEKEAEEEAQVNLHKSGLKVSTKTVPEKVENAADRAKSAVKKAARKTEDKVGKRGRARTHTHATHTRTQVEEVAEDIKEEASDVASSVKVAVTGEPEKPKKKGWRKYILFGPRREE
ncbi:unnamed protein product [Pylaiella littoralis]